MTADAVPAEARDVSCFVIGPIGNKHADIRSAERTAYEEAIQVLEEVVAPACAAFGINAIRADQITRTGEIPEQVFRAMRDAHLVIADLTGANANVMYELGLRHTTGKLTIPIGEYGRLPFDVASIRTIMFRRTAGGLIEARRQLSATIAEGLARGGDPVAATRVWFEASGFNSQASADPPSDNAQPETTEVNDEPGFLEKLAATSEGLDSLSLNLEALTAMMRELNDIAEDSGTEMNSVIASGGNAGAQLAVANRHARKLEEPSARLEILVGDYRQTVERMHPGMIYAIAQAKEHANSEGPVTADARSYLTQVRSFITETDQTWPALEAFRQTLLKTGEAARSLRRVHGRIAAALKQHTETATYFAAWRKLLESGGA